jgi:hypothetical protein
VVLDRFAPTVAAASTSGGDLLGLGARTARPAAETMSPSAHVGVDVLVIGSASALFGGLIARTGGAFSLVPTSA